MKRVFAVAVAGAVNVMIAIAMGIAFVFSLVCEPLGNGLILSNQAPVDPAVQVRDLYQPVSEKPVVLPTTTALHESGQYQTVKQVDQIQGLQTWSEVGLPEEKTFALGDCSTCHRSTGP